MEAKVQNYDVDIEQRSEEWLALRKSKIGASDAAIIMGISPWKTQLQLWEEKTGRKEQAPPSYMMLQGIAQEEHIRQLYELQHETFVVPKVVVSEELPWAMASLDGITPDNIIVEFKLANKEVFSEAKKGNVVPYYFAQIQHQLACVPSAKIAHFFIMRNGGETCLVEVERDEKYIAQLMALEKEFYEEYMLKDCPPPFSEKDYVTNDTSEALSAALEWQIAKQRLDDAKTKEEAARKALLEHTDDGNTMIGNVKCTKSYSTTVSYKQACVDNDIDVEKYTKQTFCWKLKAV